MQKSWLSWQITRLLSGRSRVQTPDLSTNKGLGKIMLAADVLNSSVQMIALLGSGVKLLALSPSSLHVKPEGDELEPTH